MLAVVVGLAVIVGGSTATVLQPLRTIAGSGGGGDSDSDNVTAGNSTSTTAVAAAEQETNRHTTTTITRGTATTRRSSSPTTAAGPATSVNTTPGAGTDAPPPMGDCKASDLSFTTATNKSSYRPNESVVISLRVRNNSDRPCYAPRPCGVSESASVTDSEGSVVWKNTARTPPCNDPGATAPLLGGRDTYDYGTVGTWNQALCQGDGCTGDHAPVGSYRATAYRGGTAANGVTFALRT